MNMQATETRHLAVLSGGFGTRIRSAIGESPKALADINGEPFLKRQIDNWMDQGINCFTFLLHYKAEEIIEWVDKNVQTNNPEIEISYSIEPRPLGTGGAIAYAVNQGILGDIFFVANADTWLKDGLKLLKAAAPNTILVQHTEQIERYGGVSIKDDGFVGKFGTISPSSRKYIYTGIAKLTAESFFSWTGQAQSLEQDIYPRLCEENSLRAVVTGNEFDDIGVPEDYYKFCKESSTADAKE